MDLPKIYNKIKLTNWLSN